MLLVRNMDSKVSVQVWPIGAAFVPDYVVIE